MSDHLHNICLAVHPQSFKNGTIYAELTPAGQPWYRRLLPWVGNWWYEIHSTNEGWHHKYDGGAYTLRGALFKAMDAVEKAAEENK